MKRWALIFFAIAGYSSQTYPAPCTPTGDRAEAVALDTQRGCLHGSLAQPEQPGPHPLIIILAGSGPTDRDGNQPGLHNNAYQQLAQALRARGIASLRYDKRGVAESVAAVKSEAELRFEDLVDDARAWLRHVSTDRRFNGRFLLGHSEGSLVALLVAAEQPVDGVISVAGPGRPIHELMREQILNLYGRDTARRGLSILERIAGGQVVTDVPAEWMPLFRPSVQPFLMSWFRYDPARVLATLKIPVLVLQGARDRQVTTADAQRLTRANSRASLQIIETMNHVLKTVPTAPKENLRAYEVADFPLAPELVAAIQTYVEKNTRTDNSIRFPTSATSR